MYGCNFTDQNLICLLAYRERPCMQLILEPAVQPDRPLHLEICFGILKVPFNSPLFLVAPRPKRASNLQKIFGFTAGYSSGNRLQLAEY